MKPLLNRGPLLLLVLWAAPLPAAELAEDLRSPVATVRATAATAMGRRAHQAAVPALVAALNDPQPAVRREAAKALAAIPDARATAGLIAALRDGDPNVRFCAAYALGEIKAAGAADALFQALDDSEWCVRDQAAWALREIGEPSIGARAAAMLARRQVDASHLMWLVRQLGGPPTPEAIAKLLASADPEIRWRAASVLVELRQPAAVESLLVAVDDPDARVRRTAIQGLLKSAPGRIEKRLAELAAREKDAETLVLLNQARRQGTGENALMGYWSFDDQSTAMAKDVTGRGNDGKIRGCSPTEGKAGSALRFGKGQYVSLGKPPQLPIADQPFTLMAWVRTDSPNGVVVARGGAFCGFSLYVKDGVAKFGIHREQQGPTYIAAGTEKVVGRWVHLAGVVGRDRIAVYVDGKQAGSAQTSGPLPSNCGQGMEIGFDEGNTAAEITTPFEGIIDEVKMFGAALSEEEIAKHGH